MNNTKNVSTISLALTYAGCFFGAGYVSGQELWQFFGSYGNKGYIGLIISSLLFFIFGSMLLRTVQLSSKYTIEEVLIPGNKKLISEIISAIILFFMFGIFVIMCAGAGALVHQIFDISKAFGCFLFCILVFFASLFGISGAVKVFSVLIPFLVTATILICFIAIKKYGITPPVGAEKANRLLGSSQISAITYVSFNIIASVGTLIPLGKHIKNSRRVYSGVFLGCIMMFVVALGIIMAITTMNLSVTKELPMLDVAFTLGDIFGYVYSILLIIGMFGTSLASIVAISEYFTEKKTTFIKHKKISLFLISVIGFIFSLIGFGNLVGTVYPIFGYAGFGVLALILYNFIKVKKNKKL